MTVLQAGMGTTTPAPAAQQGQGQAHGHQTYLVEQPGQLSQSSRGWQTPLQQVRRLDADVRTGQALQPHPADAMHGSRTPSMPSRAVQLPAASLTTHQPQTPGALVHTLPAQTVQGHPAQAHPVAPDSLYGRVPCGAPVPVQVHVESLQVGHAPIGTGTHVNATSASPAANLAPRAASFGIQARQPPHAAALTAVPPEPLPRRHSFAATSTPPAGGQPQARTVRPPSPKLQRGPSFGVATRPPGGPVPVAVGVPQAQPGRVNSFAVRVQAASQAGAATPPSWAPAPRVQSFSVGMPGVAGGLAHRAQSFGVHGLLSDAHRLEAMRRAMAESALR